MRMAELLSLTVSPFILKDASHYTQNYDLFKILVKFVWFDNLILSHYIFITVVVQR